MNPFDEEVNDDPTYQDIGRENLEEYTRWDTQEVEKYE